MNPLADKAHKQGMPHSDMHSVTWAHYSTTIHSQWIHWFIPTSARFLFRNLYGDLFLFYVLKIISPAHAPRLIILLLRGWQHAQSNWRL